jgi:hypothetical protein
MHEDELATNVVSRTPSPPLVRKKDKKKEKNFRINFFYSSLVFIVFIL